MSVETYSGKKQASSFRHLILNLIDCGKDGDSSLLPEHSLWYLPLYLIPYFLSGLSVVKECFLGIKNQASL